MSTSICQLESHRLWVDSPCRTSVHDCQMEDFEIRRDTNSSGTCYNMEMTKEDYPSESFLIPSAFCTFHFHPKIVYFKSHPSQNFYRTRREPKVFSIWMENSLFTIVQTFSRFLTRSRAFMNPFSLSLRLSVSDEGRATARLDSSTRRVLRIVALLALS